MSFPPFTYFVEFIQSLSSIMNDPRFNYDSTTNAKYITGSTNHTIPTRELITSKKNRIDKELQVQSPESETEDIGVQYCPLHNAHHALNKCRSFNLLPIRERKEILFKSMFCFSCCESNKHTARDCKKVIKCSECNSRNTTAMHFWTDS